MYTIPTIILSIIVFLIGLALGSIIEGGLKKKPAKPDVTPPEPPRPAPPSEPDKLAQPGDVNIFGAWRTSANQVWLEMDGQRLQNKEALDPGQYQRLLNLVLDLRPWLETSRSATPGSNAPTQPAVAAPTAALATPLVAQPSQKANAPVVEEPVPAPVAESIIQQIDRVLQIKLATSPFKDRGIQLVEGPGGVVIVRDGANKYDGLEGIPDPEIKSLIRQAVSEWENATG